MGYTKDAIKGISWIGLLRLIVKSFGFVEIVILARILAPEQFGAYGIVLLELGLLEVFTESGINVILIQEKEFEKYINSAWIVSIVRGFLISLFIIISAPFVASFFHSPLSLQLLYLISIVPILRGFLNPAIIHFQKELRFRKDFFFQFPGVLVDTFVSITFCYLLKSPMGIVFGLISGVVVQLILSFFVVNIRPRLQFNKSYISKIIHRGRWVTAGGIFNYLFHNADNIIVGKFLGTASLGIYQIAYSLSILPITEIADVFSRVTFPVYTKMAMDKGRLSKAFLKTTFAITLLSLPFGLLLVFFPKQIILFILGEKWILASSLLPILGIFAVFRAISGSSSSLFLSVGKQEYVTVVTFVSIVGLLIPIIPLTLRFGIFGAAMSALIGTLVAVPFFLYYTLKVLR